MDSETRQIIQRRSGIKILEESSSPLFGRIIPMKILSNMRWASLLGKGSILRQHQVHEVVQFKQRELSRTKEIQKMAGGLFQGQRFVQTRDTKKAASIVSMGVRPFAPRPVQKIRDIENHKEYIIWAFEEKSHCGRWKTIDLLKWYNDDEWFLQNEEHPYAYAIASLKNRESLLDIINRMRGTLRFNKGGQLWYIPEDGEMHRNSI